MKVLTVALAICMLSVIGCSDEETAPEYRWNAPVKTATVVPTQVPTGLNTVTPEPSKTESIELKTYTVVTGDSLSVIAQKYDTSVEAIQAVNDLSSTVILVDQKLLIPPPDSIITPSSPTVEIAPDVTNTNSESDFQIQKPRIIEIDGAIPKYSRSSWSHWNDADGDCQNARAEVLIDESMSSITFRSNNKCTVDTGYWEDAFSGIILTEASDLDVDHMVPLKNAHDSGGWSWNSTKKKEYANDLSDPNHLIAVSAGVNRSKGAKSPDQWKPPLQSYWCTYATNWISIKNKWNLGVTYSEWSALEIMLAYCDKEIAITQSQIQSAPTMIPTPETKGLPIGKRTMQPVRFDPNGPDRDCGDFPSWEEAQDFYEAAGSNNAHGLDRDRDGIACAGLR
tara:strand:+ start:350 stop:1534 length:1185 start_codon:yes stop_codon:yes gene_type:complete